MLQSGQCRGRPRSVCHLVLPTAPSLGPMHVLSKCLVNGKQVNIYFPIEKMDAFLSQFLSLKCDQNHVTLILLLTLHFYATSFVKVSASP